MRSPIGYLRTRLVLTALLSAVPLAAQQTKTVVLENTPSCATCAIRMIRELTLGDTDGPGSFLRYTAVVSRDSRGRLLVIDGPKPPMLFDAAGRFTQNIDIAFAGLRRSGTAMFGLGDSILVFDNKKLAVFTPSGTFARRAEIEAPGFNYEQCPDGRFLYLGRVPTLANGGYAFHTIAGDGQIIRSFGDTMPVARPAGGWNGVFNIALSRDNTFWVWNTLRYRFTRRDTLGDSLEVITGAPKWWFTDPAVTSRPPIAARVREDNRRILWLLGWVPSTAWTERFPRPYPDGTPRGVGSIVGRSTAVLEAIDLDKGAVITTLHIPGMVIDFVDNERLAIVVEPDGIPRTEIWRFRLEGFSR